MNVLEETSYCNTLSPKTTLAWRWSIQCMILFFNCFVTSLSMCLPLSVAPPPPRGHDGLHLAATFTFRRPSPWHILVAALSSGEGQPDEQRLIWRLLNNYDPAARPVFNASHTVTVKFGYTLTQIADMVRRRHRYARVRWTGAWLCSPRRTLI